MNTSKENRGQTSPTLKYFQILLNPVSWLTLPPVSRLSCVSLKMQM